MKNKLQDLNDHLYAQLERLTDEDLEGDALKNEIARSKAAADLATQIIDMGELALKAQQYMDERIPRGDRPAVAGLLGFEDKGQE